MTDDLGGREMNEIKEAYQTYLEGLTDLVQTFSQSLQISTVFVVFNDQDRLEIHEDFLCDEVSEYQVIKAAPKAEFVERAQALMGDSYTIMIRAEEVLLGYIVFIQKNDYRIDVEHGIHCEPVTVKGFTRQQTLKLITLLNRLSQAIPLEDAALARPVLSLGKIEVTPTVKRKERNPEIQRAMDYIKANLEKQLTLEDVAAEVHFSQYYFSKLFKKEVGMNFVNYLHAQRINQAKLLLVSTDHSIQQICKQVGFSQTSYFSKIFKELTDHSPSNYRRYHQANAEIEIY